MMSSTRTDAMPEAAAPNDVSRRALLGSAAALGAGALIPGAGLTAASASESVPARDRRSVRPVVLITGTSSGFGQLTAVTMAREGYQVYASMRHVHHRNAAAARQLEGIARDENLALEVVEIDVRSDSSVDRGVRRVLHDAGGIDVLVNNAGIFYPALVETLTIEQVQQVFETNVFGQLRMNRAVLPTMRDQGEGLVVQVTSAVGRVVFPFQGTYSGAKWAMEAMAQISRYELAPSGVDVVLVEPGAYPTDLIDNARIYYRDYLRKLSRQDRRRRQKYGDLATRLHAELEEPTEPDPQEVADAILKLVRTPPGHRPLRTLVGDLVNDLFGEINEVHQRIQDEVLVASGYGDLIGVEPR